MKKVTIYLKGRMLVTFRTIIIALLFIQCNCISSKKDSPKNSIEAVGIKPEIIDYETMYKSLVSEYYPEITTEVEFDNFKKKSNYIKVIEAYDVKNSIELFGGKKYADNISYYELPTNINSAEYGNNGIIFGDLNNDGFLDVFNSQVYYNDGNKESREDYITEIVSQEIKDRNALDMVISLSSCPL